jgi:hypothetical protein
VNMLMSPCFYLAVLGGALVWVAVVVVAAALGAGR